MSIELGHVISEQQQNISYRSFRTILQEPAPHNFDTFESMALKNCVQSAPGSDEVSRDVFADRVRLVAPVIWAPLRELP